MEERFISSLQNAKVKHLVALREKPSERRRSGHFVVEGLRETERCIAAGYKTETLFWCREIVKDHAATVGKLCANSYEVTLAVYEKIAMRGSTEGVVAIVKARDWSLETLPLKKSPLVVVLEGVEKPGNIGAVLRSADAAGVDAVIICDPLCDLYNPQLIRSSLGARFSVPTVACTSQECIDFLKSHGITILTAQLQDSHPYYDTDMHRAVAIVMGTESTGLTDQWRRAADTHIRIPMLGSVDSLNVSVSAAVLMYEAVRQRIGTDVRMGVRCVVKEF